MVYVFHGFFLPEAFMSSFSNRFFTLLQLLVLFWIASSLLKEKKLMHHVLFTFVIASAILALGLVLHLPGFSEETAIIDGVERSSVSGVNSNELATLWALAMVALIGLCLNSTYKYPRLLLGILAISMLISIMRTGSRVGTGALIIGLLVYLLPYRRSKYKWLVRILVLLSIAVTVYLMMVSPSVALRWQESLSEGRASGREKIVPAAINMISERPLLGWQPVGFQVELARRVYTLYPDSSKDAHNLFLHLLLEVGVVGTVPFLVGLWLCGQAAWKARSRHSDMLPLALFCTVLAASMSQTPLLRKPMWLVLALTSASAYMTTVGQANRPRKLLITRAYRSER
jgi:O-antigen ligase